VGNDKCTGVLGVPRRLIQDGSDHSRPGKVASRHRMLGMVACDVLVPRHQHSWLDRLPLGTRILPSALHRILFSMTERIVTNLQNGDHVECLIDLVFCEVDG
jgi:hypothetical protein